MTEPFETRLMRAIERLGRTEAERAARRHPPRGEQPGSAHGQGSAGRRRKPARRRFGGIAGRARRRAAVRSGARAGRGAELTEIRVRPQLRIRA